MDRMFCGFTVCQSVGPFGDNEIWVQGHGFTFLVGLSENGDFDSLSLLDGNECVLSLDGEQAKKLMLGFSLVLRNQHEELRKEVK